MKKVLLTVLCLAFLNFAMAQRPERTKSLELEEVTLKPLNADYSISVIETKMPPSVRNLERKAARFDVRELRAYNRNYDAFEVFFKENNGSIIATYDRDGKILQTHERFKNIALPPKVRNYLYLEYPGWIISKDIYMVSYYDHGEILKTCKVQLSKGKAKKNLALNLDEL